jgi:GNAT superfamily N-acetyltransferase
MGRIGSWSDVWLRKLERNWQDHGLVTLIRKSLTYLLKPAYEDRVYRLYKIDLQKQATAEPIDIDGVQFRCLVAADVAAIDQIQRDSEWLNGTLEKMLKAGALCIAGFEDGKLAGFNLISFGNVFMPLVNLHRLFRRDEAWSEQISVAKDYRKRGLASNLRYRVFQELRKRGFRKLYGGALVDNVPSLKLTRRVGFREFADIRYRRLFNSKTWQYTRVRP